MKVNCNLYLQKMLILELGNTNNWQEIYTRSVSANFITETTYHPIEEFNIPFLITARFMAFRVTSNTSKPYYRYGGLIKQKFRAGMIEGGVADITFNNSKRLYLNQITLLELKQFGAETALSFTPPYYFEQINLTAWEYTGPVTDTIDNSLSAIQSDVSYIKSKVQ
jgi:hypothetical protein